MRTLTEVIQRQFHSWLDEKCVNATFNKALENLDNSTKKRTARKAESQGAVAVPSTSHETQDDEDPVVLQTSYEPQEQPYEAEEEDFESESEEEEEEVQQPKTRSGTKRAASSPSTDTTPKKKQTKSLGLTKGKRNLSL